MMRTKIVNVPDRSSTITGYTVQQFVTLPAAPWEKADNESEVQFVNVGSKVTILGVTFANVSRAAKELRVERTSLANALMFDRLQQYLDGQLARERAGIRPNKTFTALYEKSLQRKNDPQ
jgi:hypothetical protein